MDIDQIIELRLRIGDPNGYIAIEQVSELPLEPNEQTAYRLSSGAYVDMLGERVELYLSDARLDGWINAYGIDAAECRSYTAIAALLGGRFRIVASTSGAESTEYAKLGDLYKYYRNLSDDCKERNREADSNTSGRFGATKQIYIGGGMI